MSQAGRSRRIVGVSTKMYFDFHQTLEYIDKLIEHVSGSPLISLDLDIFIIPDHVCMYSVARKTDKTPLLLGAQNCFWEDSGAFTGEVSPSVLAEVGCQIVELGHAERRRLFGETDETTAKKAAAVARNGMIPLVCIGEKNKGEVQIAVNELRSQVDSVIEAVPDEAEVVLAYEPVWAIGAAEPAGAEHVVGVTQAIRGMQSVQVRKGTTRILYGGSAGPGLFEKLKDGVDGLFLGRFAHDPAQFYKTIQEVASA